MLDISEMSIFKTPSSIFPSLLCEDERPLNTCLYSLKGKTFNLL